MAGITPENLLSKIMALPALYSSSFLAGDENRAEEDAKIKYCVWLSQQSPEQMWISQTDPQLSHCMCSVLSPHLRDSRQINPFLQLYLLFPGNHPPWKNKTLCNEKECKTLSLPPLPTSGKTF